MSTSSTILMVPGLHGSGTGHWQTWWQQQYPNVLRVEQDDWEVPDLDAWAANVRRAIDQTDGLVWIVAHSFSCLASLRAVADDHARIGGLLLVAPADPEKFSVVERLPKNVLDIPSILVASTSDPWLSLNKAVHWANLWGSHLVNIGDAGHINIESGFGPWPGGLVLLQKLMQRDFALFSRATVTEAAL